ncbi:MAG: DUF3379 family protein [Steroidobacteraceae bacterium]
MKCRDARFAIGADPAGVNPALAEHLDACGPCMAHLHVMQALDERLREAMAVAVPATAGPPVPSALVSGRARPPFLMPLALAASVAAVSLIAGLLWIGAPRPSLASEVVAHLADEPDAWTATVPLAQAEVAPVLLRAGISLQGRVTGVTYAHGCRFRGRYVPHLVVWTADGPVTVLVLLHENVRERTAFADSGYSGALIPATRGSIAVLAKDGTDVDRVAAQATAAIHYEN